MIIIYILHLSIFIFILKFLEMEKLYYLILRNMKKLKNGNVNVEKFIQWLLVLMVILLHVVVNLQLYFINQMVKKYFIIFNLIDCKIY